MYRVIVKKPAKKFVDSLPSSERRRIVEAIELLPRSGDIKRLQGQENLYRLRIGPYRIIYAVDHGELVIYVIGAGNRGDIYKKH